jgi:hypothetical protein
MNLIYYILIFLIIALAGVIMAGVLLMGKGGKANFKYANKLMVARVTLQGLILLIIFIIYMGNK